MDPSEDVVGRRAVTGADRTIVAETRFCGILATSHWPRDVVAHILPPPLELEGAGRAVRDGHPVLLTFGEHDGSKVFYASLALPTGVRFRELVIAIPFVRAAGDAESRLFVARVLSGEPVVTWSGNVHYGYAKRMVPMEWLGETFVVSDEQGALLAGLRAEPRAAWHPALRSRLAALGRAVGVSRLPVLGHRVDGGLVRSRFEWDLTEAMVRPVRVRVAVEAGSPSELASAAAYGRRWSAVEVSGMRWRLSWPETPSRSAAPTRRSP
jgi:hypothetical protein